MPKKYLAQLALPDQKVNPLFGFLGIAVKHIDEDCAVLMLPLRKEFIQGGGAIAGGIISTLADEAMAHVVIPNLEKGMDTVTIEMNIRFLSAVKTGVLKAEARLVRKGRKVMTVTADVTDENDKPVAHAGASFMVIPRS